jgi:hypothetical protein
VTGPSPGVTENMPEAGRSVDCGPVTRVLLRA